METWDRDFGELVQVGNSEGKVINLILDQVGHYKNWREWSHTVHNLDKGEGPRRREDGRREDYSRDHR